MKKNNIKLFKNY